MWTISLSHAFSSFIVNFVVVDYQKQRFLLLFFFLFGSFTWTHRGKWTHLGVSRQTNDEDVSGATTTTNESTECKSEKGLKNSASADHEKITRNPAKLILTRKENKEEGKREIHRIVLKIDEHVSEWQREVTDCDRPVAEQPDPSRADDGGDEQPASGQGSITAAQRVLFFTIEIYSMARGRQRSMY